MIKKILIIFSALTVIAIKLFGEKLPYINVSQNIFLYASLVMFAGSLIFSGNRGRTIVFIISLSACLTSILPIKIFSENLGQFTLTFAFISLLSANHLDLKKTFSMVSRGYRLLIKNAASHFWTYTAVIISLLIILAYKQTLNGYFEGDEWIFFRTFREAATSPFWFVQGFIQTYTNHHPILHAAPVSNMLYVMQYRLFALNFEPYIIQSIITHILVSLSLVYFTYQLTGRKVFSASAGVLFALVGSHAQAVTWTLAALYTENSLLFSLLSLSLLLKYSNSFNKKTLYISAAFLALALLSKETAIASAILYPALYLMFVPSSKRSLRKDLFPYCAALLAFIVSQLAFRTDSTLFKDFKIGDFLFSYILLASKSFSQALFTSQSLLNLTQGITDMQFPYFNLEKTVRGTNYLAFTQGAGLEFTSHIVTLLTLIPLYFAARPKKWCQTRKVAALFYFLSIIPIALITLQFPWWKYQSIVDSRHLYSITPAIVLLFLIAFDNIATYIHEKSSLSKRYIFIFLVGIACLWQMSLLKNFIHNLHTDMSLPDRAKIVSAIQHTITKPQNRMVIYTESNKTFYGFAELILPFQTPFSQVAPLLFDKRNHPLGLPYPKEFFDQKFLSNAGIISQGYYEKDGYGLGYFLDKNKLTREVEKNQIPLNAIYGFLYNADSHNVQDISPELRQDIKTKLDSRTQFMGWSRFVDASSELSFLFEPTWNLNSTSNHIEISQRPGRIMTIDIFHPQDGDVFSAFVENSMVNGEEVGTSYTSDQLLPDLDKSHITYIPNANPNILFTVAGNNRTFYKFEIFDKELSHLIFRTMEFIDDNNDAILL